MTFDPSESYDEERVCLGVTGEFQGIGLTAYTSPDAEGNTYFPDGAVAGGPVKEQYKSPFKVDIVLWDMAYPPKGTMDEVREEVGEALSAQFDGKVDAVFDKIKDSDDAFDAVLDLETDDIIVSEDYDE